MPSEIAPKNVPEAEPPAGSVTRIKTKKLGLTIYRQAYKDRQGRTQYSRSWYYKRMVLGKSGSFPLGVRQRTAEKIAEEIECFLSIPSNTLQMAMDRYNPRAAQRAQHVVTIGECLDAFERGLATIGRRGHAVSLATFKGYQKFLFLFLAKVDAHRKGVPFKSAKGQRNRDTTPWRKLPLTVLTAKAVMDFKMASMPPDDDKTDEEMVLKAKISADSCLTNARSIFGKQALRFYAEDGIKVPDLSGFLTEPDFGAKKYFQILPPAVIVPIMRASLELRVADADAYRAFLLAMHCGLRAAEVKAFDLSWLREEDRPQLRVPQADGDFSPKHGKGRRVNLERWVADALRELGPMKNPTTALVRLSEWMRALIPSEYGVDKPIHEMRKCWTSAKSKTAGIFEAVKEAGHKDIKTTATHYADNQMADWLTPLWQEPTEVALKHPKIAVA